MLRDSESSGSEDWGMITSGSRAGVTGIQDMSFDGEDLREFLL